MLLESGIFWLREKWKKVRGDFGSRNISREKEFMKLSVDNSDVRLVVLVYLIGVHVPRDCITQIRGARQFYQ